MFTQPLRLPLLALLTAAVLGTGCVTNGRQLLLKEYGPGISQPPGVDLHGKTISIGPFTTAPTLNSAEPQAKAEEPASYKFVDMTKEQTRLWDSELKAWQKRATRAECRDIGNMRNGFGMIMSHVCVLNDPAAWLADSLKLDLEALGAKVVDGSQSGTADIMISGTVQVCSVDMYFSTYGDLVVDLSVQPNGGPARHRQVYTHGATAAPVASTANFFHALRQSRQKFSTLATQEIAEALKR